METLTQSWNSIGEFHHYLNTTEPQGHHSGKEYWDDPKLESRMSVEKTMACAAAGGLWPEGAKNIQPVTLDLDHMHAHDLTMPEPVAAVCGHRALVPAYLADSPYSMIRNVQTPRPNRLIRVAVHVGKSFTVASKDTFNRGSAILSVLSALTSAGYSIELWACWHNQDRHSEIQFNV